jgi:lipopolysaccharide transport system ATP-binding protein
MTDIAIRCENLSKQYRLGERESYKALRDVITNSVASPFRRARAALSNGNGSATQNSKLKTQNSFWALDNVSFEVKRGEVIGIIGRNGAGKSTLLKILSRITKPTRGHAKIHGRVGSLLEVGTGFHPELTGRENIYLNAAILGMRKAEVEKKFDEIVAFAEVEKFIDTPVKRYSSGMYVRLAFAVAANMETEVLIVDEVLAVGDAEFQKKCLGKMGDVSSQGRTVLFVSHNTTSLLRLCPRVILLHEGRILADGLAREVIRSYLSSGIGRASERVWPTPEEAPGDSVARLCAVRVLDEAGHVAEGLDIRTPFQVEIEYWNLQTSLRPTAIVQFINEEGVCLFASNDFNNLAWRNTPRIPGLVRARCRIPGNFLAEGRITVLAAVGTYNPNVVHAIEQDAISFQIVDSSEGDSVRGTHAGDWPGLIRPMLDWKVAVDSDGSFESE